MNRIRILVIVAFCLSLFLIFGLPVIFSAATGVPLWYLLPSGRLLSLVPSQEKTMSIIVSPTVPVTIGQSVIVTVLDANNKTPIVNAQVRINEGSYGILNLTTGSDGTTQFPYIGDTTQITVSKDGYSDSYPIVIPQIPAGWVTTLMYQTLSSVLGLMGSWGVALYLYRKQKSNPKKEKANKT